MRMVIERELCTMKSKTKHSQPEDVAELRRRAEDKARSPEQQDLEALSTPVGRRCEVPAGVDFQGSPPEMQRLLHELRVHQIELEMQNEELRRAGVELDAARARYFDLYDLAPVGYVTISKPGLILEANLTVTTLLGAPRSALVKRPFTSFILNEDRDGYYLRRKQLFETGEPQTCELRMVKKDGTTFWACLEAAVQGSSMSSGPDAGTVCRVVLSDVTHRKQAEETLRERDIQLRATLEATADGILAVDNNGKVIQANRRFAELWRIPQSLMDSGDDRTLLEFVLDQLTDPDTFLRKVQLIYSSDTVGMDTLVCKDGRVLERYSLPMILDGILVGRVWSFRDITERRRVETALIDSLQRNRALLDANPDMFFVFTADGRIIDSKAERPEELYVPPADFLGKPIGDVLPPDLAQQTLDFIAEAKRTGQLVQYTYTLEVHGEPMDFESRLVPCENGTFMAVVRNITERKRADAALQRASEVLSRSNEEVRQFAYIVSHDLRAPLVNIRGFVSELRRSLTDLDRLGQPAITQAKETEPASMDRILRQDIPEALGFIDSSVIRMDQLITSLLQLSRLGHHELVPERLDLGSMVSDILASLGTQIAARGTTVTVHPLPEVTTDRTAMEHILCNILTNAVLYLDPARPGRIEIAGKLATAELLVKVSDNGRGIALGDHDKVFAPFQRGGTPEVPGEGMGLAYVQTLVRQQGGRIWFDSEPGVGTTFSFALPVACP
jgi:PAS domain S-box-containing protein